MNQFFTRSKPFTFLLLAGFMATLLQSDTRRKYSWWWDSHIPKNSKWLQENLTDMDAKVKSMIKLIEEDADSFARRAEMYYKKRPELIKLVEEFYRAYRALAERYDHLSGELRHAQKTMSEAFPNQVPFVLYEDSPSRSSGHDQDPQTPDLLHPLRAASVSPIDADALKRGLKQLNEMLGVDEGGSKSHGNEDRSLQAEIDSLKAKIDSESKRATEAESEVQKLKMALDDMKTEKDTIFIQYELCLEKLSNLDVQLVNAQRDFMRFNEQAIQAEVEVQALKEALTRAEVAKDEALLQHEKSMEIISVTQEDLDGLSRRAIKAESESQNLNHELFRLESEKEASLQNYKNCLENVSRLENQISTAEENARVSKNEVGQAERETERLKKAVFEHTREKEASGLQYQNCLKSIAELEKELSCAQEDVKRLNAEILTAATKLEHAENKCKLLEMSNQSLRVEAENLTKKISRKDMELSEKQSELERIQICMEDEQSRYSRMEEMLQTLQSVHSQSQVEHKLLAEELQSGLQKIKELEVCKHDLEDELRQVKDENICLNELKSSSTISMENLQNEILCLRNMKERLEEDVEQQIGQSNSLQSEITTLEEEIGGLNSRYQALLDQLDSAGLNPDCFGSSVRNLQDENTKLRLLCEKESNEKGKLYKKLEDLEDLSKNKNVLQTSLSELNVELEASRNKVRELEESCQFVKGEKSVLVSEKGALLSQLQGLTASMQRVLENNAVLENSLSVAKIELEGLREKSKGLEEICRLLKSEKSNLQAERSTLALQLASVKSQLEHVEKKFTGLEEQCAHLEKEKQSMHSEINELRISLGVEKQERKNSILQSENRLVSLEHHLHFLQEESQWKKKDFEDELDKAVKAQCEIFILQKFVEDMEQKNYSLIMECQKQIEASKLAEKLITELENENLEQQVESEILLDEIEKLRLGIYRVFKALEVSSGNVFEGNGENEQVFLQRITGKIEEMKHSLLKSKDDEDLLSVENTILLTLLRQMKVEGTEIELQKEKLEKELKSSNGKLVMVQTNKDELTEMNRSFESQLCHQTEQIVSLEEEVESLHAKQNDWQQSYLDLQGKYTHVLEENRYLFRKFSELKEEKNMLEQQNDGLIQETLALSNVSTVLENYRAEKALELQSLYENMKNLSGDKEELESEVMLLKRDLETKEAENAFLKDSVQRLEMELDEARQSSDDLKKEIDITKDGLMLKEVELLEVERKFDEADDLNFELSKTVDALEAENQESAYMRQTLENQLLTLSGDNALQDLEINNLGEVNEELVAELCKLHEECEEQRIREEKLSSELKMKNDEFELWESEATAFYFDLQLSSITGVFYENKVHELSEVCGSLEDDSALKTKAMEKMKENVTLMENEIGGLRAQLSAYGPIMASLREDVASLEHNVLRQKKLIASDWAEQKWSDAEVDPDDGSLNDQSQSPKSVGIQELQKLRRRIKAVEKIMTEDTNRLFLLNEKKDVKLRRSFSRRKSKLKEKKAQPGKSLSDDHPKLLEDKSEVRNVFKKGALMKDIQLDHISESPKGLQRKASVKKGRKDDKMLDLWESAEYRSLDRAASISRDLVILANEGDIVYDHVENLRQKGEHPSTSSEVEKELGIDKLELSTKTLKGSSSDREKNNSGSRTILERLTSDAQKLTNLHLTVQNLRRKLDTSDKKSRKKTKDVDLETVKEQLQEVQETVVQLVDLNGQLMRNIEEHPSPSSSSGKNSGELKEAESVRRRKVSDQARKGSEKIGRLQLEVQKLQYVLLKMEDDQKNQEKSRFSGGRTTVILRDFIYRKSGIKKKNQSCCFRPTTPMTPSPSSRMMYYS